MIEIVYEASTGAPASLRTVIGAHRRNPHRPLTRTELTRRLIMGRKHDGLPNKRPDAAERAAIAHNAAVYEAEQRRLQEEREAYRNSQLEAEHRKRGR